MEFHWDDEKSNRCKERRGFSFADVIPAFSDPDRRIEIDDRLDYGEERRILYGRVKGRLLVVVYTPRDGAYRIISARKANDREKMRYGQGTSQTRRQGR